jgi:hypothetical protein
MKTSQFLSFQRPERGEMYVVPTIIIFLTTSMVSDLGIFPDRQLCYILFCGAGNNTTAVICLDEFETESG